jgi:hypothetical protein
MQTQRGAQIILECFCCHAPVAALYEPVSPTQIHFVDRASFDEFIEVLCAQYAEAETEKEPLQVGDALSSQSDRTCH